MSALIVPPQPLEIFSPVQGSPIPHDTVINIYSSSPVVSRNGVWIRNPRYEYANGLTASESTAYCQANNARVSTINDLAFLNDGKFRYCQTGWYKDENGIFSNVWFEDGSDPKNCGVKGANTFADSHISGYLNNKLGTYCTGDVPMGSDVAASKFFQ